MINHRGLGKAILYVASALSLFGLSNGCATKYPAYNGPTHKEGEQINPEDWREALRRGDPDIRELTDEEASRIFGDYEIGEELTNEEMRNIRGAPMDGQLEDRVDLGVLRLIINGKRIQRLPDACDNPALRNRFCNPKR